MATAIRISKRPFLCLLAQEHVDFRLSELQAIADSLKIDVSYNRSEYTNKSPYFVFNAFSEDEAQKIVGKSVLIKSIYELLGMADSYDDLKGTLEQLPSNVMEPYTRSDYTFAVRVKAFNKKLTLAYMVDTIEWLSFLPFAGNVDLKTPKHEFHLLEDYGDDSNKTSDTPKKVYFGRLLGTGQRHLIHRYSLKTRNFIGNTSMDAQLAFIMANMGKVTPDKVVYDPFAGTGSILVACSHYGAYVLGADIDWNIIHGKGRSSRANSLNKHRGRDENVRNNLAQYSLEHSYLDMLVNDASCCVWREQDLFDAIITDPPYGIREGLRRVEDVELKETPLSKETKYTLSLLISDLIEFAAKFLVVGGRLVYWLPFIKNDGSAFDHSLIPSHPCLSLVSLSEQCLFKSVSRWLVTMEKLSPYDSSPSSDVFKQHNMSSLDSFRDKYFQKQ